MKKKKKKRKRGMERDMVVVCTGMCLCKVSFMSSQRNSKGLHYVIPSRPAKGWGGHLFLVPWILEATLQEEDHVIGQTI